MTNSVNQRRTLNPNRLMIYRFIYPVFLAFAMVPMLYDHFKMGALCFIVGLMVIGFQFRWRIQYLMEIPAWRGNVLYGVTWILGLWGVWFDFFTGSAFFFAGAMIKGFQMGWTLAFPIRLLLFIMNISIAGLLFFLHLKYSVGWSI